MNRYSLLIALALTNTQAFAAPEPFNLEVPAHGFEEHCLKLEAGDRIHYRYAATADVAFNIHYHRGNDVLYPVKTDASRAVDARFTAPQSDTFCLMWERKGNSAVRVEGTVERVER